MQKSVSESPIEKSKWTTGRTLAIGLAILIVAFLIIGTINDASAPEPEFSFGIQSQSFFLLALLAFGGGLLSFLSPCTLPILPAYFAFAFQSGRKTIAANTMMFLLGLATMFSLLGAGASAIGRVLQQSQQVILLVGGAGVLIFGVVSLLGGGFGGMQAASHVERDTSLGGSFIFGLTFAVGWSSCVGPILGAVLTLAATTGSVLRGVLLLFIYAIGLGLPLLVVSTLFGRASRQSLFWRVLRGKGWSVKVPTIVVGLVWALAIWRILVEVAQYAFFDPFTGPQWTSFHEYGLLAVVLAGAALWAFTNPGGKITNLELHSTSLVSGILFVLLGLLMLGGQLATFNSIVPPDLALWFADFEEAVFRRFSGG